MNKDQRRAERREHVELLAFMHGLSAPVVANILGVEETVIRDDLQVVRDNLLKKGEQCSESATEAFEEVAALQFIARGAISEAEVFKGPPRPGVTVTEQSEAVAMYMNLAARCFFYVGRLKQGLPE